MIVLVALSAALFADEDENDMVPGLVARYRAGGKLIVRIDPDVAFEWKTDSPDPRLARGPFAARWAGQLLIREGSPFRFHAFLQGNVAVTVDGRTVLAGRREHVGWISGDPVAFGFGEKPFEVTFDAAEKGATLKLFWSSARFPLEPLPAHLLFCDPSAIPERKQIVQIEAGRREFEIARCNRCHRRPELFSLAAPSLVHVADGLSRSAIIEKIGRHSPRSAGERMPTFDLTRDEAAAIAAFLLQNAQPAVLDKAPAGINVAKEARKGETHVCSLGCLACHTIPGRKGAGLVLGNSGAYGGGDLVGGRFETDGRLALDLACQARRGQRRPPHADLQPQEEGAAADRELLVDAQSGTTFRRRRPLRRRTKAARTTTYSSHVAASWSARRAVRPAIRSSTRRPTSLPCPIFHVP